MIRGIIFDMDGVLIEAKDWHYEALNRALHLFGFEISRYDHLTTFDGLPTRRKLQILSAESGLPFELHEFINDMKQSYTMEIVNTKCKPRFVHEYALSSLKNRGYRLGVASNSIRHTIEVMMEKAHLDKYLEFYVSNEDVSRAKPDPEMYEIAIQRFELQPHECVIVEDNENGIKAAKAAGAHVLVVQDVVDVNLDNITRFIADCDKVRSP